MSRIRKIVLITLLFVGAFCLGIFSILYIQSQPALITAFLAKVTKTQPLFLNVHKKFNDTIYYASDRKPSVDEEGKISYLDEYNAGKISYGSIHIQVPETHSVGEELDASVLKKITPLSASNFTQALQSQAKKTLVIWVHGHKNSFTKSLTAYAQIAHDLNTEATFLSYDWTSNNSLFGYADSVQQIAESSNKFADLLDLIIHTIKPRKIVIIAHSLGCRLVCEALQDLDSRAHWSNNNVKLDQVIFLAPNVDRQDFNQRFKDILMNMVNKLTVYIGADDNALLVSKLIHNINSVGLPEEFMENESIDEIQALLYYQKLIPHKINIIDTSYFSKKDFIGHVTFRERPVLEDMHDLVEGNYPVNRRYLLEYDETGQHSIDYWMIPP